MRGELSIGTGLRYVKPDCGINSLVKESLHRGWLRYCVQKLVQECPILIRQFYSSLHKRHSYSNPVGQVHSEGPVLQQDDSGPSEIPVSAE